MAYRMLYLVALKNGMRPSDGVADMGGTEEALWRGHAKSKAELNERYPLSPEDQAKHDAEWTYVVVDEEGLAALPFAPDAYRPDRST